MKATVIYHSESGNTAKMAGCIVEGLQAAGLEAKAFSIDEVDMDFAKASKVLLVGTPVYAGSFSGKMKMWLEKEAGGVAPGGKLCGAFATANFIHGGADVAILAILNHLMVMGAMLYSGGAALGQPFIHYGPVAIGPEVDKFADLFKTCGQRMGQKAMELFKD